jgi:hypothetical protein
MTLRHAPYLIGPNVICYTHTQTYICTVLHTSINFFTYNFVKFATQEKQISKLVIDFNKGFFGLNFSTAEKISS